MRMKGVAEMKKTPEVNTVRIPEIPIKVMRLGIEAMPGSPLVMHRFSEGARSSIAEGQSGKPKHQGSGGKPPRHPEAEMEAALHRVNDGSGRYGIPGVAFKLAAVRAAKYCDLEMTYVRGAFHVVEDMVPIEYDEGPIMRTDAVRIGMGKTTSLAYRPEFRNWRCTITIRYNEAALNAAAIVNLFNVAGFAVGVLENRPGKSGGSWGMFCVAGESKP